MAGLTISEINFTHVITLSGGFSCNSWNKSSIMQFKLSNLYDYKNTMFNHINFQIHQAICQ